MFTQRHQPSHKFKALGALCLAVVVLSACTSVDQPLHITNVSVSPNPIVGQVVTLEVEVTADNDEPNVTFTVDTLESAGNKIHLVSGNSQQQVSLVAHQPQTFQLEVCVIQEGSWPIEIRAVARHPDGSGWDAFEKIQLESTLDSGKLIRSKDYTFSQQEYANRPE